MHNSGIAVLVLAAGLSERMGSPKLLLEWKDMSLLERAVRLGIDVSPDRVMVTLGAYEETYSSILSGLPVKIKTNPIWKEGMGTSIACGVKSIIETWPDTHGILIMLADQPLLNIEHLNLLLSRFDGKAIVSTGYPQGRKGVPAIFPGDRFDKLIILKSDKGARDILNSEGNIKSVIPSQDLLLDIDTADDLERLRQLNLRS